MDYDTYKEIHENLCEKYEKSDPDGFSITDLGSLLSTLADTMDTEYEYGGGDDGTGLPIIEKQHLKVVGKDG